MAVHEKRAPSKPTSRPTDELLSRAARLACEHHRRWKLCHDLQLVLEPVQRAGIWAVEGEVWLLAELRKQLDCAVEYLDALAETPSAHHLEQLESLLGDESWDVAEEVLDELAKRHDRQQEMVRQYSEEVAEWRDRIVDLRGHLERARKVHAPILREENEFLKLEAHVALADRMLKEPNFIELEKSLRLLDTLEEKIQKHSEQLQARATEAQRFNQQADLLLLRSPTDLQSRRLHYTVLLRTPSEPGTHGINIESSSTLVEQDSQEMRLALDRVTDAINHGLTRRYESSPPAQQSRSATGVTRDLAVDLIGERVGVGAGSFRLNDLIQDVGELLYRLIIPEQMHPYLTGPPCSLTITSNDLELPWELMFIEENFLCLRLPVARMPMGRAIPRKPRMRRNRGKLRFLFVYADPEGNLPLARQEVETIAESLRQEWGEKIEVETVVPPDSSGRRLNDVLRKGEYDVIHYAGHAGFDKHDGDLSGLLLHGNELFFAQKIRRLMEGRPLVFINACESACVADEQQAQRIDRYLQGPAEGLASAFIYGGAVGCIGSLWPVYDGPAAEFAVSIYRRVLEGYTLGEAMRLARVDSREAYPDQITWATFVLYGDPRFRLVD